MSLNRAMEIGNLGSDPVSRNLPTRQPVVGFSIATDQPEPTRARSTHDHSCSLGRSRAAFALRRFVRKQQSHVRFGTMCLRQFDFYEPDDELSNEDLRCVFPRSITRLAASTSPCGNQPLLGSGRSQGRPDLSATRAHHSDGPTVPSIFLVAIFDWLNILQPSGALADYFVWQW
jgi:hypothetical protein